MPRKAGDPKQAGFDHFDHWEMPDRGELSFYVQPVPREAFEHDADGQLIGPVYLNIRVHGPAGNVDNLGRRSFRFGWSVADRRVIRYPSTTGRMDPAVIDYAAAECAAFVDDVTPADIERGRALLAADAGPVPHKLRALVRAVAGAAARAHTPDGPEGAAELRELADKLREAAGRLDALAGGGDTLVEVVAGRL